MGAESAITGTEPLVDETVSMAMGAESAITGTEPLVDETVSMAMGAESAIIGTEPLVDETVSTTVPTGPTNPATSTVQTTMPAGGDAAAYPLTTGGQAGSNILDRVEYSTPGNQKFIIDLEGYAVVVHNDLSANLAAFPQGLLAVTLLPAPWEAGMSGKRLAAGFESIVWLPLFVLAGVGAWIRRRDIHVVALPASLVLAVSLSSAVTQGNLGTAFRHRGQILFALAILAMAGLQATLDNWRSGRMS
jgi:hypothetical protein